MKRAESRRDQRGLAILLWLPAAATSLIVLCLTAWVVESNAGAPRSEFCAGMEATITGTAGVDRLVGTPERDVISSHGGDDLIRGLAGGDVVCVGAGADTVYGGPGKDRLKESAGGDDFSGNKGRDHLSGGTGADRLQGNGGRDHLSAGYGGGHNVLRGGDGADFLDGSDDGAADSCIGGMPRPDREGDSPDRAISFNCERIVGALAVSP